MIKVHENASSGSGTNNKRRRTLSRRYVLVWSFIASISTFLVSLSGVAFSFLEPVRKSNTYGGRVSGGSLNDLPEIDHAPRLVPEGRFWLINNRSGVSALHSSCTHLDCKFKWDGQKNVFSCPCHGSEFDREGTVLKGPAKRSLDRFPIELVTDFDEVIRISDEQNNHFIQVSDLRREGIEHQNEQVAATEKELYFVRVDTGRKISGTESSRF